jgi:LPXTG-motif cell wall-anchored protein
VESRSTTFILTNSIPKDPPDTPQTGDSANILLAVVLLNLSGAGLIALGLFRKRYTASKIRNGAFFGISAYFPG